MTEEVVSGTTEAMIEKRFRSPGAPSAWSLGMQHAHWATAHTLALQIIEGVPAGRERALALTKLEECLLWSGLAMARNDDD
jgi:hypothetical protein